MKFPTFKAFTWRRLVFAAIVYFMVSSTYNAIPAYHQAKRNAKHAKDPVTTAQLSSHMVTLLDEDEKPRALCSATAVGPHTIMTAAHCNLGKDDEHSTEVQLDYSVRNYHILSELDDGQDHVMYLLDGPAFKSMVTPVSESDPNPGDEVVLYGDGAGAYPPRPVYGVIDGDMRAQDVSDVDRGDGIQYLTMNPTHGDSGSAVYDLKDGHIVGLLTYGVGREKAACFALNFPPDAEKQLEDKAAAPKSVEKKPTLFTKKDFEF